MASRTTYITVIGGTIFIILAVIAGFYPYVDPLQDKDKLETFIDILKYIIPAALATALVVVAVLNVKEDKEKKECLQESMAQREELRRQQEMIKDSQFELKELNKQYLQNSKDGIEAQRQNSDKLAKMSEQLSETHGFVKKLESRQEKIEQDIKEISKVKIRVASVEELLKMHDREIHILKGK